MKNSLRILCLLLVSSLMLTIFASCNSKEDESSKPNSESEVIEGLVPHLEKRDLNNFEIVFLHFENRTEDSYDECQFNTDETREEPVNDAFYKRNRKIESEYNCKIKLLAVAGGLGGVKDKLLEAFTTQMTDFHVVGTGIYDLAPYASEGKFYDFNDMPNSNLKLDGDWWDQAAIRDVSIGGVMPFVTGDIVVVDNESTWAVYFNKDLIEENELENPFDLVRNNEWTIDKMNEMAKQAERDDGDGIRTVTGNDHWGLATQTYSGLAFMWGARQPMITKDKDDLPVFRIKDSQNISTWDKVFDLLCNQQYTAMGDYFYKYNSDEYQIVFRNFVNGNVLFRDSSIAYVNSSDMRNAEKLRYGILPMPKFDKSQDEYSSSCTVYWATFLSIPRLVPEAELDKITYILEAMAYLGKEMVTYQYYDVTLKNKRVQDEDSPEMLELIFKNRTFDLAAIYNWGDAIQFYTSIIGSRNNGIVGRIDAAQDKFEQAMNTTIELFEEIKGQ